MANKAIKSVNLLPEFFRTDKNSKFLSSTIDQLIQSPQLERIDGYIGSKITPTYVSTTDNYISESLPLRKNYQLEPALVVKDNVGNISDVVALDDLTNEIGISGGKNNNLDRLYRTEFYSYNPHIDWDKLINYQEYYWLPTGPDTILITGQQKNSTSTYAVRDSELGSAFIFNPNGLIEDPLITLYRGNTYHFEVTSESSFYIKTAPSSGTADQYTYNITNNGTSTGIITLVVNQNTPLELFYVSGGQPLAGGKFIIKDITLDSAINIETEILGKKNYISGTGIKFSNGMKVIFGGDVYPAEYANKEYFVEGVGTAIKLIEYGLLSSSNVISSYLDENFDANAFDEFPYDNFKNLPLTPEYITINRASRDLNPWTKYNRWFHKDVIAASAEYNGLVPSYPADKRAKRPIIEFKPNLKLYNFGSVGISNVDYIDTKTEDAFSTVEGTAGYYVDGNLLEEGNTIIFSADTDIMVRSKVYRVNYPTIAGNVTLTLTEIDSPSAMSSVSVNSGNTYGGSAWWFDGDNWQYAQQHTSLNEAPLFDLFDNQGNSYSNKNFYLTNFTGNKIFSYDVGTGTNDPVLGFPLNYRNSSGVGSYLFRNNFAADTISITANEVTNIISTNISYCKFADDAGDRYENIWSLAEDYQIPILQFQEIAAPTSQIELNAIDNPTLATLQLEVFVDTEKLLSTEYSVDTSTSKYLVNFTNELSVSANVLFKIYTDATPNENGYYETPLSLTNNPLNGTIESMTLSELSDHLHTMVHKVPEFDGLFPGASNLRDIANIERFGRRLIVNANPIAFANMFIGRKEHSLIDAISKAGDQYNQYKLSFLKKITEINDQLDPISAVDLALKEINADKDMLSAHYLSDMVAYGTDKIVRTWTVTDSRNTIYPITSDFDPSVLSLRSVLVYLNNNQLLLGRDYTFLVNDSSVEFLVDLVPGDIIVINDYTDNKGCFVPATPTKLGLYPKYQPQIISDTSYIDGPVNVIQGHDGSLLVAYNDYRDAIILELEKRIYNNIKTEYRAELFDINSVSNNAYNRGDYSTTEINQILQQDFIKWAGFYGIDTATNSTFDEGNPFTWNYQGAYNDALGIPVAGYWRSIYKHFYDTDRPHSHPWEMLGFSEKPMWWEAEYGPAPYTSGNEILWSDLEQGIIRQGIRAGTNPKYARPGLSNILPVNASGDLVDPTVSLASNVTIFNRRQGWKFGDQAPAETAWRRSSYWPFAVQRLLALTKPAVYASLMYDPSRITKNIAGQWTYGAENTFLTLNNAYIHDDENYTLTSGYSVFVSEAGQQRTTDYIQELRQDLDYANLNLFHKVGGFVSKDKLQIIIDAYDPTSTSPGALLPQEDYELILNVSNPIKSIGISGLVIQKKDGKFVVKGYNKTNPYFSTLGVVRNSSTPTITVGGVSEPYVTWTNSSSGETGLSAVDTTSAASAATSKFYQQGQIVFYGTNYYRVKTSHEAEATFNSSYYQILSGLPTIGGVTVQTANRFNDIVTEVPYGTEYTRLQDIYDLIIGYGAWLETQGFIFDEYNSDFRTVIDWNFTAKEFLYWSTQNWANNSVIALSPFADRIKYSLPNSVVDNVFNSFYEYSILQANGTPLPKANINVSREDGVCTISTLNSTDGIYFATVRSVQKEHAMVFDNYTKFGDTIYSIETGYRQLRMKLSGFRTSKWDGDYFSPGFVYDTASVSNWKEYVDYQHGDLVRYKGKYYSANVNVPGTLTFDFSKWQVLSDKPAAGLIPNFDYKIRQFEDFYSLDIDNFDAGQQKMAQHLTGYTPRVYLNNIFTNPISQYKFYQGFIKEKGTKNAITKLAKASSHNLQGEITYNEEWAFRIGQYGSYQTYQELEIPLVEGTFIENPQVINFVETRPSNPNDLIYYSTATERVITPDDYVSSATFVVTPGGLLEEEFALTTAGYVRLDDVTATAYNENSLLDIANNRDINEGDVIWLGFKQNGDWDVLRYTDTTANVIGVFVSSPVSEITFVTDIHHGLSVGDVVSVSQFNDQVNGIYVVKSLPSLSQFTVASTLSSINNEALLSPGLLFKFSSFRFGTFDGIPADKDLLQLPVGTKLWVDNAGSNKWAVYEKVDNYSVFTTTSLTSVISQRLGWAISKRKGNDVFAVSAPYYNRFGKYGSVSLYRKNGDVSQSILKYSLNDLLTYTGSSTPTELGYSLVYDDTEFNDTGYGLVFAGAPSSSYVKSTGVGLKYSTGTEAASSLVQQGLVKISSVNPYLVEEKTEFVLVSPDPIDYERFGSSLFVERSTRESLNQNTVDTLVTTKNMFVGATQYNKTETSNVYVGQGAVYSYEVYLDNNTSTVSLYYTGEITTSTITSANTGSQWGYSISGSDDASIVAISAPGYPSSSVGTGVVHLYNGVTREYVQTINSPFSTGSRFGEKVLVSPNADYLFISAPFARGEDQSYGKVAVYKQSNSGYTLDQIILNPVPDVGMKFGIDMDVNTDVNALIISALGSNRSLHTTFDKSSNLTSETTFDSETTEFFGNISSSGTAYVYDRKDQRFVLASELSPLSTVEGTNYGHAVALDNNVVYVGAPAYTNTATASTFYQFNKIDTAISGWNVLREQDDLVAIDNLQKITLIDSFNEEIVDYLDIIDPLKGRIAGLAEQELKYKSAFDPAVYSIGVAGTVNDTETNWLDDHVGELWWDLSTVKYTWYEQGDPTHRKNNWGKIFPGATIDVYEWVGSEYLPSEWSSRADTSAGLTEGISGQPKYADNSVISVKQVYSSVTNSFSNYYYYWVKNKVTVPDVRNRRMSSYQVSSMIADPTAYGLKYAAIISADSIALANVGPMLVDNRIHLNIATDTINNKIPRHTEWLLLQEGAETSVPNTLLEKKLIDSLIGHDSLGNVVPNPTLTSRTRYGIGIRPQQTLFKDRLEALRNLFEFTNSVLLENRITGNYNFNNLNKKEEIPDEFSHEYDQIVEDNESLSPVVIDTRQLITAKLRCTVMDGKIRSVTIDEPGFGYKISPTVTIISDVTSNAVITTEIDAQGRIISTSIENPGNGFVEAPKLEVRPYTVIVLADSLYNNKWTKFVYDTIVGQWVRVHTQKYNTSLYWKYVDWVSSTYNPFVDYKATVDSVYEVNSVDLQAGDYVKVKNGGLGWYIILEKTNGTAGTFSDDLNIVYSENGTIQILDTIWDIKNNNYGYDQINTYDQTLFDQVPDLELQYILTALKTDLFVNDLKVNWNLFFFKAVKYALSEQKLLDWAFKTSFINVKNNAGPLDQRPVYKITSSTYYEQYLEEVKPYHTNIRSFTTEHTVLEPTRSYTTDFDLPAVYNKTTDMFTAIEIGNDLLNTYPWKSWADNYTYSVGSIIVGQGGAGYTVPPAVVIRTADGDTGFGATGKAFIRSGEVISIEVTNAGSGYSKAPIIELIGGGDLNLTPAIAYAQLVNEKVRTNKIGIKFDRTSRTAELGLNTVVDTFIGNGSVNEFVLNWLAQPDKTTIVVKLDDVPLLSSDYTIEYYSETFNDYSKKYSKVRLLNIVPATNQVIKVTYEKNTNLLNATERIVSYYTATSGMPGVDLAQLMTGIEYPKTRIDSLQFGYSTKWDIEYVPFGESSWADEVNYYTTKSISSSTSAGSDTIYLDSVTGLIPGQYANIISGITNKFNTTTDIIITSIYTASNRVSFNYELIDNVDPGETIEFWTYNSNMNILDSAIDGGTWGAGTNTNNVLIGALGINPEDISIDGDGFYTPNTSYAPEELVPGEVIDSVGINVYTKNAIGAPMVLSNSFDIYASTNTNTVRELSIVPPNVNSITVVYRNKLFEYTTTTDFTSDTQYTIDWETNEIIVSPQPHTGKLGYTIVTIGGGADQQAGVIDHGIVTTTNSEAQISSLSSYYTVKTAYVTVNGVAISPMTTSTDFGYVLTYTSQDNYRAAVNVYNLPSGTNTIQAWFFGLDHRNFNEITEQVFDITDGSQLVHTLAYPPGNIEPVVAQAIIEVFDGTTRRRLTPPYVSYYEIIDSNRTFEINNHRVRLPDSYSIDSQNCRIYLNGDNLRPGFDYTIDSGSNTVTINSRISRVGDVIAIVDLFNTSEYDYDIEGDQLTLGSVVPGTEIKVITFTDHDGMLMRTERFEGSPSRKFRISRPVLNNNYVWVSVNGIPLTSNLDYVMLDDDVTVQISDEFEIYAGDEVVITSISSRNLASTVLGYRIFNDIFNRTHFKRLAKQNTTHLTKALSFTDTEIHVADASVLTPPLISKKIPGVVLIDGERIEFFKIENNVLKQLRRSTLGTSPSYYSEEMTKVIDQSPEQNIPFVENIYKQTHYTTASVTTYTISTVSDVTTIGDGITLSKGASIIVNTGEVNTVMAAEYGQTALSMTTGLIPTDLAYDLNGDGVVDLADAISYLKVSSNQPLDFTPVYTSNFVDLFVTESVASNPINAVDQVLVYYGGRLLKKTGTYYHDTTVWYDSLNADIVGTTSTAALLPITLVEGESYIVEDTNQVWTYTGSLERGAVNGFVYKGLNYLPPEFSINTSTQELTLNIQEGIGDNVKLTIIKKEFERSSLWNDQVSTEETVSLLDSTTDQAIFLQARPAELPDIYFYGGDQGLISDNGFVLTTDDNEPLEGF